jgi:pSer/pThr/pTyr-binding forkhead associated (FHA) protein
MTPKLIVASGKSAGRAISIKREKLMVGRADECDVRPLSEEVSRRHCIFLVEPAGFFVEDLRSRNGTFVNGVRIEGKRQLQDADIVRIGNLELKVSCRVVQDPSSQSRPPSGGGDDEVSRWLMADEEPAGMFDTTLAMRVAEETAPVNPSPADSSVTAPADPAAVDADATVIRNRTPAPKTNPAFVAQAQKKTADSSRAAAADALKKFFGNR